MKIKCSECVKWNDIDFRDKEFTEDELVTHLHEIHNTTPQREFIAKYVKLTFKIHEKIEVFNYLQKDRRTVDFMNDEIIRVLKSLLENKK